MSTANRVPVEEIHIIIGPAHPGAQKTLIREIRKLQRRKRGMGRVYRVQLPWELMDDRIVREGVYKAVRKLLELNNGRRVAFFAQIFAREEFGSQAGLMAAELYVYARNHRKGELRVRLRFVDYDHEVVPTVTIVICSDYRLLQIQSVMLRLHPGARILALPGELTWLQTHPAVFELLRAWVEKRSPGQPWILLKHGGETCCPEGQYRGCAYRQPPCISLEQEFEAARSECLIPTKGASSALFSEIYFVNAFGRRLLPLLEGPSSAPAASGLSLAG